MIARKREGRGMGVDAINRRHPGVKLQSRAINRGGEKVAAASYGMSRAILDLSSLFIHERGYLVSKELIW